MIKCDCLSLSWIKKVPHHFHLTYMTCEICLPKARLKANWPWNQTLTLRNSLRTYALCLRASILRIESVDRRNLSFRVQLRFNVRLIRTTMRSYRWFHLAFLLVLLAVVFDLTAGQKIEEQLDEAKDDDNEVNTP